jgi:hypothetical protein
MKLIEWLVVVTGITLIIVNGLWSDLFKVDSFTILILFVLSLPFIAQYLRKAKFPGAEFEFKEEINETKKFVQLSVEKAKKDESSGKTKILPFETFELTAVKELLDSDYVLALAALRIEIERKLRLAADFLGLPVKDKLSIFTLIETIKEKNMLSSEQISALRKIFNMCNKAIHGFPISEEEAREIIDLAEELNKTFSLGYSIDFSPNFNYEEQDLTCEWEHCIEWMPPGMMKKGSCCN